MAMIIGVMLILAGGIVIWFNISYSPVRSQFEQRHKTLRETNPSHAEEVFETGDFADMPAAVQNYMEHCGYIGTPKYSVLNMGYLGAEFHMARGGKQLQIDYYQMNGAKTKERVAYIDSAVMGIPFEGLDFFYGGAGGMKGVLAKSITLFDQKSVDLRKAGLATYLAEMFFLPSILLEEGVHLEEIDEYHVSATITQGEDTVSGVFTFNEQYELISFVTKERANVDNSGNVSNIPWIACCSDYKETGNGLLQPTRLRASWEYEDGEFTYFDGTIDDIVYE